MNRLIETLLFICLGFTLSGQDLIEIFDFDGTDNLGFNIDPRIKDCDNNVGTFGPNGGVFEIRDVEGLSCCGCAFSGGGPQECGDNSSMASSDIINLIGWCNVTVRATVGFDPNAVYECRDNSFSTGICLPQIDPGKDAMKIEVLAPSVGIIEIGSYCGDIQNGTFELTGINEQIIQIIITGGTEAIDEAYFIENIVIEGFPQSVTPPSITEGSGLNNVCVGDIFTLLANTTLATSTFQWALDGVDIAGATNQSYTVAVADLNDGGIYTVEVSNLGGSCAIQTATYSMTVSTCTVPPATFTNLRQSFCRDFDVLSLPLVSNEGYTGTWDVDPNLVLNTVPIFNSITFIPDLSTGADPFIQNIQIDEVPVYGTFDDVNLCVYDEPGEAINLISELNLRINDIVTVTGFNGMTYFDPPNDGLENISLNGVNPGTYVFDLQTIPYGRCGQQDTTVNITISKIDRVSSQVLDHCEGDPSPQDFNNLIEVDRSGGTWSDTDATGINVNTNPNNVDLSGLAPGSYEFRYEGVGQSLCPGLNGSASVTVNILQSSVGTYIPPGILCENNGFSTTIGGILFDENNTTDNVTLTSASGCDSIVMVDLVFLEEKFSSISHDGCEGDGFSVTIDNVVYNEANPSPALGEVILSAVNGCDSTVTVDLIFKQAPTRAINPAGLCQGDPFSVTYNGRTYNESNPNGTEIVAAGVGSCDSVITIALDFQPAATGTETYTGCTGDNYSVIVNGVTYDETMSSGTETLIGGARNGCDSVVTVDLTYISLISSTYSPSNICIGSGFSRIINGMAYDETNRSGSEVVSSTTGGCDTMLTIDLQFLPLASGNETYDGCTGDLYSTNVNGMLYNEINSSGTEILIGQAQNGCDSTVTIDLIFKPLATGTETYLGKEGDGYSVTVGTTLYNEQNPTGIDTLLSVTPDGCDSVITTTLTFIEGRVGEEVYTGCIGDGYEVTVGNTTYNEENPTGLDSLLTSDGIDSVVSTMLTFNDPGINTFENTYTMGGGFSIMFNNMTYDESNPSGIDTLQNMAANGCDSIIIVNLSYVSAFTSMFDTTLCFNDSYTRMIGNSIYDESNPSGVDTILNTAGIDLIITTTLTFVGASEENIDDARCAGDGYSIDTWNRTFNEANPSGRDTLTGGDKNGCDSVIIVNLVFNTDVAIDNQVDLCPGESVTVQNSTYDENNLSGMDTITTGTGCDTIITTTVTIELILIEVNSMPSCDNADNGSITVLNMVPVMPLTVTLGGQDFPLVDSVEIPNLPGGMYDLIIANNNGCSISQSAMVDQSAGQSLSIDTTTLGSDSLILDPNFTGTIAEISWSASSGVVCTNCTSINISRADQNDYTLTVVDDFGCSYTATLSVTNQPPTNIPSEPAEFYISNAITAIGGSRNALLYLQTNQRDIVSYNLAVYSRWGSIIFDRKGLIPNDQSSGWNATQSDQIVESGVYIYKVEVLKADGSSEISAGDVLVIK